MCVNIWGEAAWIPRATGQPLAPQARGLPPSSFSEMPVLSHRHFLTECFLIQLDLVVLAFHSNTREAEAGGWQAEATWVTQRDTVSDKFLFDLSLTWF